MSRTKNARAKKPNPKRCDCCARATVGDKENADIVRLYVEEGLSVDRIAERLGRSSRTPHEHIKRRALGDVNYDGVVDICDLVLAAVAFGFRPGDPNWNPQADLFYDNLIDIRDLVIIGINYGKTW